MLASDQYIAVVLPGRMFRGAFAARGLAPVVLSRALGDSATVTSPLIPWNSCGAYMAATLGVATTAYVPFAFFNLLNPLISIAFAFLGLRMLRSRARRAHSRPQSTPPAHSRSTPMTPVRPNQYLRASAAIIALGIAAAPAAAQQVSAADIDRMMAVIEAQQAQIDAMRAELNALKAERTAAAAPAPPAAVASLRCRRRPSATAAAGRTRTIAPRRRWSRRASPGATRAAAR